MTESEPAPSTLSGRTAWARNLETPLRQFLRTETGSAAILLAATIGALVWANVAAGSYESFWSTRLSVIIGSTGLSDDLHGWVNSGLMTFFFLVVGLEARREFDMGELRERRRLTLPLLIGLGGMIVPVAIYLAANAGGPGARGWGTAMSTDTAFALGMLALVGSWLPDRVRTYLLTFSVVDDLVGLAVIAIFYSARLQMPALLAGLGILVGVAGVRAAGVRFGPGLLPARRGRLGGVLQVRRGPGGGGAVHGPAYLRPPGGAQRPGAGQRPVPAVPRAAHPGAGARGPRRRHPGHLPQRAAPAAVPPVVQLSHRAAVRPGQRRAL